MLEANFHCPSAIKILVACKQDLRDTMPPLDATNKQYVTTEEGYEMAKKLGFRGFIETSSKTSHNVEKLHSAACGLYLQREEDEKLLASSISQKAKSKGECVTS